MEKKVLMTIMRFSLPVIFLILSNSLIVFADNYTMTYLFGGTTATYTDNVSKTKGMLNAVAPDFFEINPDGTLLLQKINEGFVDNMHSAGILIIPYLSNNWDKELGIKALNNAESFTTQLKNAIYENNLDGVDVDIQNVSHEYKEKYTNFVRLLREKMPDKQISVAVAANPNGWTTGWHGSYDYANLSEYADYLMLMAYDESYFGSQIGPVASKTFVEKSIDYALKHTTPEKIVLGLPFYGRYWKTGETTGGQGITAKDCENLILNYKSQVTYDNDKQSVKVTVTISNTDVLPRLWGGNVLSAGEYTIWYDNIQSLKYKFELSDKHKLYGTGSWALGQENILVWDEYELRKNKSSDVDDLPTDEPVEPPNVNLESTPLLDISAHWANNSITSIYHKGWMTGVSPTKFEPERKLTRAEAASALVRVAALPDVDSDLLYDFNDTKKHWARDDIAKARFYGLLNGRNNNLYYPNDYITREEISLLLDKIFNLTEAVDFNNNPFKDVDKAKNNWSYNSIIKLSENKIISGYLDGTFKPKNKITRAETATLLSRLSGFGINSFIAKTTDKDLNLMIIIDEENEIVPEDKGLGEFKEIQLPR